MCIISLHGMTFIHISHFVKHFACLTDCQPLQFWILSRHGTRYSDEDDIDNMWSLKEFRDQIISNIKDGRKYC